MLLQVAGNAISYHTTRPYFDVLDLQHGHWSSLPDPPIFRCYSTNNDASSTNISIYIYHVTHLPDDIIYTVARSNLLVSSTPAYIPPHSGLILLN